MGTHGGRLGIYRDKWGYIGVIYRDTWEYLRIRGANRNKWGYIGKVGPTGGKWE